ncbi:MAG: hypothetical protein HC821_00195 [Lewinella sp.]|nr:hypothetical protein [Lewinella sp.]
MPDLPILATLVERRLMDLSSHKEVYFVANFINLLTHPVYVLQIGRLPTELKTELEEFLSLFNQAKVADEKYILNLENIPSSVMDIAVHLTKPLLDADLRHQLSVEAEIETEFALRRAETEEALRLLEEERHQKEEERQQKEAALQQIADLKRLLLQSGTTSAEIENFRWEIIIYKIQPSKKNDLSLQQ